VIRLSKILVPVDLHSSEGEAVDFGVSLAIRFHAQLELAHVVPPLRVFNFDSPERMDYLEMQACSEAKEQMPTLVPGRYQAAVHLQSIVKTGNVQEEVLEIIRNDKIDLIVMGTHRRGSLSRFFLGSTTENILRRVPVPILTVPQLNSEHEVREYSGVTMHRIVYAADLSSSTRLGLHYAAEFAKMFNAKLTILHVMDAFEPGYGAVEPISYLQEDRIKLKENVVVSMENLLKAEYLNGRYPEAVVIEGSPHQTITHFAEEHGADLVILNLQSKGFLERAMLGATAERVIRSARVPVLSLPIATADAYMDTRFAA